MVFSFPHKSSCGDIKKTPWTERVCGGCVCVCVCVCFTGSFLQKWKVGNLSWLKALWSCPQQQEEKGEVNCGEKLYFHLWEEWGCELHLKKAGWKTSWRTLPTRSWLLRLQQPRDTRRTLAGTELSWELVQKTSQILPCLLQEGVQGGASEVGGASE